MSVDSNYDAIMARGGEKLTRITCRQIPQVAINPSMSVEQKYIRIVELVDRAVKIVGPSTPCKKGCSSCCNIAVAVTEIEARRISAFTGRPYAKVTPPHEKMLDAGVSSMDSLKEEHDGMVRKYFNVPCPFLVDHACSIYEVRPLPCRTHHNLADDNTACDLNAPLSRVSNMDWGSVEMAQIITHPEGDTYGDIREFFPAE